MSDEAKVSIHKSYIFLLGFKRFNEQLLSHYSYKFTQDHILCDKGQDLDEASGEAQRARALRHGTGDGL